MTLLAETLTPYSANRFVFFFSIAAIGAVVVYFAYGAVDRIALEVRAVDATVVSKHHNPIGHAFNTVIAGNRVWIKGHETSETYVAVIQVAGGTTAGLITPELFESLKVGDTVRAKVRRTRISRRLEAIEVTKI